MVSQIISAPAGATLVGGGPFLQGDLDEALCLAPVLVAADGGADGALAAGRLPDRVIGDLDSISPGARARIGAGVIHDACQNTTDFQKCLRRIRAPFVLGLGFLGGRLDHELAALATLVAHAAPVVLIGARDVVAHVPVAIDLALPPGTRCSLFPMGAVSGVSEGLEWPIAGLHFHPGGQGGTSNRVTGPVRLRFDQPGMLIILPRRDLGALLVGLRCARIAG